MLLVTKARMRKKRRISGDEVMTIQEGNFDAVEREWKIRKKEKICNKGSSKEMDDKRMKKIIVIVIIGDKQEENYDWTL